jgi:hypothetical protein
MPNHALVRLVSAPRRGTGAGSRRASTTVVPPRRRRAGRAACRRLGLAVAFLALLASLAPLPALAQGSDESFLRRQLEIERRLLRQDLTDYAGVRQAELDAQNRLDTVADRVSAAVQRTSPSSADLVRLRQLLDEAAATVEGAVARSRAIRESVDRRLQRMALLTTLVSAGQPDAVENVLSGVWNVAIAPADTRGTFELRQDGTVVTGTYRLDDGSRGSLRGTFIDGRLLLERVDSGAGFNGVFEAYVAGGEGRLAGFWQPTDLATGGPGGGGWAAVKVSSSIGEGP